MRFFSAEVELAELILERRDVQSRINDVLKEIDDLKAENEDTSGIEVKLVDLRAALKCLQDKIDSKPIYTILFKRRQVPVSSEALVKDDCSNLIEESCSEVSVEERTIPEFLFDENSEDPSVVNIVQMTPEIDNRRNCSLVQADTIEETPLVAEAVDAVENVSAVTSEAPVSSLERGVRFLNPTHEQIKQAQKDDDILNQVYGWVSKGEKPEVIQAGRLPQELWLILVSRFSR